VEAEEAKDLARACRAAAKNPGLHALTCLLDASAANQGFSCLDAMSSTPLHFLLVGTLPSRNFLGTLPSRNFLEFQNTCARCLVVQALPLKRKP
jgi:hypothetical protein